METDTPSIFYLSLASCQLAKNALEESGLHGILRLRTHHVTDDPAREGVGGALFSPLPFGVLSEMKKETVRDL